jgi:hypothetical protein
MSWLLRLAISIVPAFWVCSTTLAQANPTEKSDQTPKRALRVEVRILDRDKPLKDVPFMVWAEMASAWHGETVASGVTDAEGRWSDTVSVPINAVRLGIKPASMSIRRNAAAAEYVARVRAGRDLIRKYTFHSEYSLKIDEAKGTASVTIVVEPAITARVVVQLPDGTPVPRGIAMALDFDSLDSFEPPPGAIERGKPSGAGVFLFHSLPVRTACEVFVMAEDGRIGRISIPASDKDIDLGTIRLPPLKNPCEVRPSVRELQTQSDSCIRGSDSTLLVSMDGSEIHMMGGLSLGPCKPSFEGEVLRDPPGAMVSAGRYYALGWRMGSFDWWEVEMIRRAAKGENLEAIGVPVIEAKAGMVTNLQFPLKAAREAIEKHPKK